MVLGFAVAGWGALAFSAFAASVVLTNGGLGQIAGNTQSFGLAVCNGGAVTIAQSVPILVSVNGTTATITSAASIAPGVCEYSYANYNQLGMVAGQTYSVNTTIDPNRTLISNSNNQATYSITVPAAQTAAVTTGGNTTTGSTNFLGSIGAIFTNFFAAIRNLF